MISGNSTILTCLICVCGTIPSSGASADDRQQPSLAVRTKRADDKVDVRSEEDKTVLLIRSPFGISQADIERRSDKWPQVVVIKLQLKGLEHLRLTNGKTTLEASVAAHDGKLAVRVWKDKAEDAPLERTSPYWIAVRMLGSDGKPAQTVPLNEGVFELILPKAFLEDNPKSITIDWIDFYRG